MRHWEPGAEIRWFGFVKPGTEYLEDNFDSCAVPNYVFTKGFTLDSAMALKRDIKHFQEMESGPDKQDYIYKIKNKLNTYTETIQKEKPFLYHVGSRLICLKRFALESRILVYYNATGSKYLNLMIRAATLLFHYSITILAPILTIFWIFYLLFKHYNNRLYLIAALMLLFALGTYLAYPFMRSVEGRYLFMSYHIFLGALIFSLQQVIHFIRIKYTNSGHIRNSSNF